MKRRTGVIAPREWPKCRLTGKKCLPKKVAEDVAREIRRSREEKVPVVAYPCPFSATHPAGAHRFHVGHDPRPAQQRRARRRDRGTEPDDRATM